jgi:hypothetical protein
METFSGELDAILAAWPEGLDILRARLAESADTVRSIASDTKNMGRVMQAAADIYANADRACFNRPPEGGLTGPPSAVPRVRAPAAGVYFMGGLVMQDWLQAAVLNYEQSTAAPRFLSCGQSFAGIS